MLRIRVLLFVTTILISWCSQKYHIDATKEGLKSSHLELTNDVVYGHDFGLALTYDVYLLTVQVSFLSIVLVGNHRLITLS